MQGLETSGREVWICRSTPQIPAPDKTRADTESSLAVREELERLRRQEGKVPQAPRHTQTDPRGRGQSIAGGIITKKVAHRKEHDNIEEWAKATQDDMRAGKITVMNLVNRIEARFRTPNLELQ